MIRVRMGKILCLYLSRIRRLFDQGRAHEASGAQHLGRRRVKHCADTVGQGLFVDLDLELVWGVGVVVVVVELFLQRLVFIFPNPLVLVVASLVSINP